MAIDLSAEGIAAACGPAKSGTYEAKIADVATTTAQGGGKVWHLAWKCQRIAEPLVEDVLVSVAGRRLAPGLGRLAEILQASGRELQFENTGSLMRALVGCTATLAVTVDPWSGAHSVVAYTPVPEPVRPPKRAK